MKNARSDREYLSAGLVEVELKSFTPEQVARELENSMEIICDTPKQRRMVEKTIDKLNEGMIR